jgi:hypothetical protein
MPAPKLSLSEYLRQEAESTERHGSIPCLGSSLSLAYIYMHLEFAPEE